ncbi:PIG-L deacetylase family protein [Parabacteroides chinchillae]|uniref:N-acetylglucosaminyl deacetylase, LmbE family n=1 Tax=Parabacteroides chinchillae TaxID=871327 RepID=A0A8G2BZ38_9BACT|nr:PIG-L family deacetylase [Parabacteroides chinchillae]SEG28107.1 N-acetylglucosaminyl deacetylase, LmbE family [Parabacteroides chinchillae]
MKKLFVGTIFLVMVSLFSCLCAGEPIRVIVFGAHPDDCDVNAGGTAALFAQMGHKVKFVSLTNGDKGHHQMQPEALAARRKKEMQEAGRHLGIVYENLDNHDGELMATLENRKKVIRMICDWKADIVITHRPNDYHPDHRYASTIVQDAAYMISVPLMVPGGEPLLKAPVFLYMQDSFLKPNPFSPDIVIDITPVVEKKLDAICAHESQVYEWLPWNGGYENDVPADATGKRKLSADHFLWQKMSDRYTEPALKWYSPEQIKSITYFEAFEVCEYGNIPDREKILQLFPMLPR